MIRHLPVKALTVLIVGVDLGTVIIGFDSNDQIAGVFKTRYYVKVIF